MQIHIVARPAMAVLSLVIVWSAAPRAGVAQQCRRACEAGETRDVRGCCVPGAAPEPASPERDPRPERKEPEAGAPATRPGEAPATTGPRQRQRERKQRAPDPAPARPASREPAPAASQATPEQPTPGTRSPASTPASGASSHTSRPPGTSDRDDARPRRPATTPTEPRDRSRPGTTPPPDERPAKTEPGPAHPAPGTVAARQAQEPGPRRHWPAAAPWAVVGAGAVVTIAGGLIHSRAASEYDAFDAQFDTLCAGHAGCHDDALPPALGGQLDRARTLEQRSYVWLSVGGATLAAGAALVFLNRPTEPRRERSAARTFVVPVLAPHAAGIAAGMSF